ncbi:MAG: TetR family transcriptional regulator [Lachnospiraceae bacterium]|nr:TetR family transcriptional regulator [Lachnospiraceae bacterium]
MDRRIIKTRKAIIEAFVDLLNNKRYSKITIQDIIDHANVGRSTFYMHFETKDELLKSMCMEIFDHIFEEHSVAEKTHCFTFDASHPDQIITHILYHFKENEKMIRGILFSESGELFIQYFKLYFNKQIEKILDAFPNSSQVLPRDFLINHISGSFIEMVRWWFEQDLSSIPEDLAKYFTITLLPLLT